MSASIVWRFERRPRFIIGAPLCYWWNQDGRFCHCANRIEVMRRLLGDERIEELRRKILSEEDERLKDNYWWKSFRTRDTALRDALWNHSIRDHEKGCDLSD